MKILLISSSFFKAEGSIAKGITSVLKNHEIFFFSTLEIKYRKEEFEYLLDHVDVVHWLFNVAHLNSKQAEYYEKCKVPQVAAVHHVCPQEINKIAAASKADVIHVVSDEWETFVRSHCKTQVIRSHIGINPNDFKAIQPMHYNKGCFRIGMMGFYPGKYNRKRPDIAIEVFKELKKRKFDFEVVLQGGGWDQYLPILKENNIPFIQPELKSGKEILRFFEKINLYLCTSDYEGGPLPVIESLESSIPAISTNVGIARDALQNGGGFLVKKEDINTICNHILKLQADNELYNDLVKQTRSVSQNFHWNNLGNDYEYLYLSTIKEWEHKNSSNWKLKNNELNCFDQRQKEIDHDYIREELASLSSKSNFKNAYKLFFFVIKNKYFSNFRKVDTLKKIIITLTYLN